MSLLQKINLIEVLKEETESAGLPLPPDITEQQLEQWGVQEIKRYYGQHSQQAAKQTPASSAIASKLPAINHQNGALHQCKETQQQPLNGSHPLPISPSNKQNGVDTVHPQAPPADPELLSAWFPALKTYKPAGTEANPAAVILCFHSAGCAEDMFTSEGTGSRRAVSPLLEAAKAHNWQIMACQLPGRNMRRHEPYLKSLQVVAQQLLPLVSPAIAQAGGQYAIVAHSMGCWAAYELLLALKAAGYPEPAVACLSAMPWPHIPLQQRPWRQQSSLSEQEFKEECKGWDIDDLVFTNGLWEMYQPLLRSDFQLFDEYKPSISQQQAMAEPFSFPMCLFWGLNDRRVDKHMVKEWSGYTTADCTVTCIEGSHLFPMASAAKRDWLAKVCQALTRQLHQR